MKYALAIDIGASSGRHILGHLENGQIISEEIYRFPNGVVNKNGHLVWDINALFNEIINGLKKAKELNKIPSVIGIDTWAVDYALLDKNDQLIGDIYAYRDNRTNISIPRVHSLISHQELYSATGIQFQPFNTIYQLYEDKMSGKLKNASTFLMLPDYLNFLLTGRKKQEYTNATSTSLVNSTKRTWDDYIISRLDLPHNLFNSLSKPSTIVGPLKEEISQTIGYQAEVVLPATHDTASAVEALDIPFYTPYISSGTWSLLGIKMERSKNDEQSRLNNWSNEGGPTYIRYQKNIMGMWLIQSLRKELYPKLDFIEITHLAEQSACDLLINANDNSLLSPKSMKEAFDHLLNHQKLEKADYFRIAYRSLAYSYKEALEELKKNTKREFRELYIVGGGAKNTFLNRLTEEICQIKVIALPIEATAIGNLKILLDVINKGA